MNNKHNFETGDVYSHMDIFRLLFKEETSNIANRLFSSKTTESEAIDAIQIVISSHFFNSMYTIGTKDFQGVTSDHDINTFKSEQEAIITFLTCQPESPLRLFNATWRKGFVNNELSVDFVEASLEIELPTTLKNHIGLFELVGEAGDWMMGGKDGVRRTSYGDTKQSTLASFIARILNVEVMMTNKASSLFNEGREADAAAAEMVQIFGDNAMTARALKNSSKSVEQAVAFPQHGSYTVEFESSDFRTRQKADPKYFVYFDSKKEAWAWCSLKNEELTQARRVRADERSIEEIKMSLVTAEDRLKVSLEELDKAKTQFDEEDTKTDIVEYFS